jgi:putative MFS transporter
VKRVWWIPPFLGRIPPVEEPLLRLLGLVSLALFFEAYDLSMLTSALKYIAEDLDMPQADLGFELAVIRLGALPALLLVPIADRLGRRAVFLASIVGVSVLTFATAFSPTPGVFVALQMATRAFIVAGASVAIVIVTEEFPAAHRGWAIGMMGALSAAGHGLGAILFAQIEYLPGGWRALYALGIVPLLFLPLFRRGVLETRRFAAHAAGTVVHGRWLAPLGLLARTFPGRAAAITLAALLVSIGDVAVFAFTSYFALTVHGWSPGNYAAMVLLGGAVGITGNIVAGRLGDRIGRRRVGATFLAMFPAAAWLFYNGPSWALPAAFAFVVFSQTAGGMVLRAFSTELFPTSQRGTSAGWVTLVQTIGWAIGLALVSFGERVWALDIPSMASLLAFSVAAGGLCLLALPETRSRELEAISDEHPAEVPLA